MQTVSLPRRAALGLVSALMLAGATQAQAAKTSSAAAQPLQIAVEGEYPPFNDTDKKGRLVGFDVDVAKALCKALNASCVLVKQRWDRMIPDLVAGKYDLVVSSMSITNERRQKIDFTNPYYQTPAKFVAKKGTSLTISPAGLKGQRIGVQRATNHEQYLNSLYGGKVELVRFDTLPKAEAALAAGKVDLVFADAMGLSQGFLRSKAGSGYEFIGPDIRDAAYFGQGIGIGVRKGQDGLVSQLNTALANIYADGTYRQIEQRYFSFQIGQWKAAASN
jgi:lysine-arginine-ornithine-binding protein